MVDVKLFQTDYDLALCDIGVVHLGYGLFTVPIRQSILMITWGKQAI